MSDTPIAFVEKPEGDQPTEANQPVWEVLAILNETEGVSHHVMESWGALYRAFSIFGTDSKAKITQMRDVKTGALVLVRYKDE